MIRRFPTDPSDPSRRPAPRQAFLQNMVNALILGLGLFLGMTLGLGGVAFAKGSGGADAQVHDVSFAHAMESLAPYLDERVRITAWMTYLPDNRTTAILRDRKAPHYQSLFAMNLKSFGQQTGGALPIAASSPDDPSLFVRVGRLPGRARAWMARTCADGCRVRVSGRVVETAGFGFMLDLEKVSPLEN